MYEIYVSKFECDTQTEVIEQHITNNTNINKHTFTIEEMKSSGLRTNYKAFKITTLKREIYNEIMDIWAPKLKARDFKPTINEGGQTNTNKYHEKATNMYNRTPNKSYNLRMDETRYETNKHNWQFTPRKNVSHNQNMSQSNYEQNKTPTNDKYEKKFTPERYNYNTERREMGRLYNGQYEQKYQQPTHQTNTQSIFLDRNKQTQQFYQGVGNRFQQGVNNQYQQTRAQHGTRFQQQSHYK